MILVVTGVGFLIHVYSIGYMAHDEERVRFFAYLNLFMFFMLMLVLGGNLPLHVRGLGRRRPLLLPADRLLVQEEERADAGKKAFIVNRIGDVGPDPRHVPDLRTPSAALDLVDIADNAGALAPEALGEFGAVDRRSACCCSSAPAARARRSRSTSGCPTRWRARRRSRALIHAATMVTAGVYMVARLAAALRAAPRPR